jgi:hypothetical protein
LKKRPPHMRQPHQLYIFSSFSSCFCCSL